MGGAKVTIGFGLHLKCIFRVTRPTTLYWTVLRLTGAAPASAAPAGATFVSRLPQLNVSGSATCGGRACDG
jgi:hypothetical protein